MKVVLTQENTKDNIEDRVTYLLSELLDDNAPLNQEHYRYPAKKVIEEYQRFSDNQSRTKKDRSKS
jgi:hypothetical protein